jgi:protein required for attachment to host cells
MTRRHAVPLPKSPVTWILVADGKQAQIYTRSPVGRKVPTGSAEHPHYLEFQEQGLVPVPEMALKADSAKGHDQLAHQMNATHINIHDEIKHHFMKVIAERLNDAKTKKLFDRLVLIAPPKMLGDLRTDLDKKVIAAVVAELPKDLTQCGSKELVGHLNNIA